VRTGEQLRVQVLGPIRVVNAEGTGNGSRRLASGWRRSTAGIRRPAPPERPLAGVHRAFDQPGVGRDHTDGRARDHPQQQVMVTRWQGGLERDAGRERRWCGDDDPLGGNDKLVRVHLDPRVALADRPHRPAEVEAVAEFGRDPVGDGRWITVDQVGLGERAVGVVLEAARAPGATAGEDQRAPAPTARPGPWRK
jgi:hypothetical protein